MRLCPHCHVYELSDYEQAQLARIKALCPVFSATLAKFEKLSLQNASNRLRKWEKAGFLKRAAHADPTGGIIYLYESSPKSPAAETGK